MQRNIQPDAKPSAATQRRNRSCRALLLLAATGALSSSVHAANTVFNWTGGGTSTAPLTGNWNNSANWLTTTIPTSAATTELDFGGSDPTTAYTATDDIAGAFLLDEIQLNSTSPLTETIAASATTNTLSFSTNGTTPVILQDNTGAFNISNNIVMTNALTVGGTGTGAITLAGNISGTNAFTFNNSVGTLNLSGTESYIGNTVIASGTANYIGAAASTALTSNTSTNGLTVGSVNGSAATLNINTTGTLNFQLLADSYIGGTSSSTTTAVGTVKQNSGTVIFNNQSTVNSGGYIEIGDYGSGAYILNGGSLTANASSGASFSPGVRVGNNGGYGSFVQNGGTLTVNRYFVVGAGASATSQVTFNAGTASLGSGGYKILISNATSAVGTMSIGTEAGGTAAVTAASTASGNGGVAVTSGSNAPGILNLNSGTLTIDAVGLANAGSGTATATVNMNGGHLQLGNATVTTLLNSNLSSVSVYNGGAVIDTNSFSTTLSAPLLATTGQGIYETGGIITPTGLPAVTGVPLVTVVGGGTGATAIANVANGLVTGFTITNPGQNYSSGQAISFNLSGGGLAATTAVVYNLSSGDVATNGTGGLTKIGTGTLTLGVSNSYTGPTVVSAGTLQVGAGSTTGNLGATSSLNIASGATVAFNLSNAYSIATPVLGAGGISQIGAGTTTLSVVPSYTGPTSVTAGSLVTTVNMGNTAITALGTGTFVSQPGSGTITLGTGGASLTLNAGGKFSMVDNAIGVTSVSSAAAATALAINSTAGSAATLTFELGSASTDELVIPTGVAALTGSNDLIAISPLASASSITSGNYTLISVPGGGLVPADFALTAQNVTIGSTIYHLSLANSTSTAEILSIAASSGNTATAYWAGTIDGNWNTNNSGSTNWRTDASSNIDTSKVPDATTNVVFTTSNPTAGNLNTTLGANQSINSLTFNGNATGAVTIGGAYTLTINAQNLNGNPAGNGINVQGGSPVTISAGIALGGDQTWTNTSTNPLVVSGAISGERALTLTGSGNFTLSGSNTYTGAMNDTTTGTVTLSGPEAISSLNVSSGTLNVNNAGALGTGSVAILGSIILDNTSGATVNSTTNPTQAWNSDFTFNGTNSLNMGTGAVTLASNRTVTLNANTLSVGTITDGGAGYTLTAAGAGNLTSNGLLGTTALHVTTSGTVTLTGSGNYTGATNVSNGTLNIIGSSTGNGTLDAGNVYGQTAVVNIAAGTGTVNFSGSVNIGDTTTSGGGVAALNISSGNVNLFSTSSGVYADIGNGGYGSLVISGGTVVIGSSADQSGIRTAANSNTSIGIMTQTGGSLTLYRYLAMGNAGYAVSTFTGGTTTLIGYRAIVGDNTGTVATFNLGTLAGGTSLFTTGGNGGLVLNLSGMSTAVANLNSGTLNLSEGSVYNGNTSNGTATLNLNGGTIQAGVSGLTLIDSSMNVAPNSVNVFNGGANFNVPSGSVATVSANMSEATGSGIYAGSTGGSIAVPGGSIGSGYVGAPVVLVINGSGTGASAIANVTGGTVTSVTVTNPGQGYQAGDNLTFELTTDGLTANTFNYTLTAADIAANSGGLTKTGAGTLTLTGTNTYTAGTQVLGGTLVTTNASALGTGTAALSAGTTLSLVASPFTKINSNGVFTPSAGSTLTLTNNGIHEAASAFSATPVTVSDTTSFTASFTFNHTLTTGADGITFVLQNQGTSALGGSGGAFGYLLGSGANDTTGVAITPSAGIDINMYAATQSVGFVAGGTLGNQSNGSSIAFLENAVPINVQLSYNGATETLTETLSNSGGSFTTSEVVDLAQALGGSAGGSANVYYGFTAGTGGATDTYSISNFSFSLANSSGLTIANPVKVVDGASATVNIGTGSSAGVGPVTVGNGSTLVVSAGVAHSTLVTPSVTFTPATVGGTAFTGKVDISTNGLDITSQSLATVNALIASGYNATSGGYWNGPGIVSSAAAADTSHLTAVGVISNTDNNGHQIYGSGTTLGLFDGLNPAATDVLVKYTYYGDANLDGAVDGSDYALIDAGFNSHGTLTGWYNGDFNYDGKVDGSDYTLIDNAFNTQGASQGSNPAALIASTSAQFASGSAAVPEPASLGIVTVSAIGLLGRRRRRSN